MAIDPQGTDGRRCPLLVGRVDDWNRSERLGQDWPWNLRIPTTRNEQVPAWLLGIFRVSPVAKA